MKRWGPLVVAGAMLLLFTENSFADEAQANQRLHGAMSVGLGGGDSGVAVRGGMAGGYWLTSAIGVGIEAQTIAQASFGISTGVAAVGPQLDFRSPTWGGYWTVSAGAAFASITEDGWLCSTHCLDHHTDGLDAQLRAGYLEMNRVNFGLFLATDWVIPEPKSGYLTVTFNFVAGFGG